MQEFDMVHVSCQERLTLKVTPPLKMNQVNMVYDREFKEPQQIRILGLEVNPQSQLNQPGTICHNF